MDKSKKHRIDQWVEDAVYAFLERTMSERQITPTDAATMTPLIQMYQAIQIENVRDELDNLWSLLADHNAGFYIKTTFEGIDVNVEKMPKEEPKQTGKGHS